MVIHWMIKLIHSFLFRKRIIRKNTDTLKSFMLNSGMNMKFELGLTHSIAVRSTLHGAHPVKGKAFMISIRGSDVCVIYIVKINEDHRVMINSSIESAIDELVNLIGASNLTILSYGNSDDNYDNMGNKAPWPPVGEDYG